MTFEEKSIESKVIYEGPVFTLRQHLVNTASGGVAKRDIIEHAGGVGVAAVTKDGQMLMIRQFRKAAEEVIWEIPAGKLDHGDSDGLAAAKRELREETGYLAENWRYLTSFFGTVGYCSEVIELYRADATIKRGTDFDPSEAIELYEIEIPKLIEMISSGEIKDAKTIIAIFLIAREFGY